MHRRKFLKMVAAGAANTVALPTQSEASTAPSIGKPNILLIISDQHRAGLTKRSGYPLDTSPTLDRMADRGVSFEAAYATQPVCVPCRTSLLTGRWPHAHRVRQNSTGAQAFFETDIFDVFKAARTDGRKRTNEASCGITDVDNPKSGQPSRGCLQDKMGRRAQLVHLLPSRRGA
jgi:hypothetical protein